MEITKTLSVHYPTVTYGNADLFVAVKVSDADLPDNQRSLPIQQREEVLDRMANHFLCKEFATEYATIQQNLQGKYLYQILPDAVEAQLIRDGRLKYGK